MVFHGFWLVSMGFQGGFMVFHGFWLNSMVFQGGSMVFHGFLLVSMIFRDLIRLLNEMDIGIKANKHYNRTNTYTSSSSWSDLLVSVLCLHPF